MKRREYITMKYLKNRISTVFFVLALVILFCSLNLFAGESYIMNFASAYNPLNKIPRSIIADGAVKYGLEATGNATFGFVPILVSIQGSGGSERAGRLITLNAVFEKTIGVKIPPPNNKFQILFSGDLKPGQPSLKAFNPTIRILDGNGKKLVEYEAAIEAITDGIRFVNPANSEQNIDLVKKNNTIIFQTRLPFYFRDTSGKTTATLKNLKLMFSPE